jgi:NADH-quinone oxidoreductase subunit A
MSTWLLLPPVAFVVVLILAAVQYFCMGALQGVEQWPADPGKKKSYACGEDVPNHRIQPDYRQFFPFAFFFTIMHVVALMVATVPADMPAAQIAGICYLLGAAVGLFILFRR